MGAARPATPGPPPPPAQPGVHPTWGYVDPSLLVPKPKRRGRKIALWLALVALVVAAAGGIGYLTSSQTDSDDLDGAKGATGGDSTATSIAKGTITGSLTLIDSQTASNGCDGEGGYSDIGGGMNITLKNETGTILATSTMSPGRRDQSVSCVYDFTFTNVPRAKFYVVTMGSGRRGDLTYSHEELVAKGNRVTIVLG